MPNLLDTILSNIKDTVLPMMGQQPYAQDRFSHAPIYGGAAGSQNLGATFPQISGGSRITMSPEAQADPELGKIVLKHEIIHSLINKHNIDTSKLAYQDPEGYHFKDNLPHRELISYALAGGSAGPDPTIKDAMEKSLLSDKNIPIGFKNDLHRLGVLSTPPPQPSGVPAGYVLD